MSSDITFYTFEDLALSVLSSKLVVAMEGFLLLPTDRVSRDVESSSDKIILLGLALLTYDFFSLSGRTFKVAISEV